ncbi:MAG: ribonuclease Z [Clostridium sp.]|uniref:ribonuclease Z n=1 Tax=Clostridium sp. DSM 8431 TaxID=1761781 RepID=UPI0008E89870|nr:ribonuclease Z [Clostridium sp. DSM 8431]MCR4943962.1 ribonuclease Z [Clostridium sp.]SFU35341.1 hypothetical protein SAMN04487886_101116 [Clostridium sp. DSM 8431]
MIVIVCLDNNNGMMFNNRRQSQDRILREHILNLTKGSKLYMNSYSYKQFSNDAASQNIIVDENFLFKASKEDYCFVENMPLAEHIESIEKIIVYKWNRDYPSDFTLDITIDNEWKLTQTEEFKGSSHDKITEEIYTND